MVDFSQKQICQMVQLKPRQVSFLIDQGGIKPRIVSNGRGVPHKFDEFNLFQFFTAKELYRYQIPIVHIKSAMWYLLAVNFKPAPGYKPLRLSQGVRPQFPNIKLGSFLSVQPSEKSPAKQPALDVQYAEDTDPGELYEELCRRKKRSSIFLIDLYKTQAAALAHVKEK